MLSSNNQQELAYITTVRSTNTDVGKTFVAAEEKTNYTSQQDVDWFLLTVQSKAHKIRNGLRFCQVSNIVRITRDKQPEKNWDEVIKKNAIRTVIAQSTVHQRASVFDNVPQTTLECRVQHVKEKEYHQKLLKNGSL